MNGPVPLCVERPKRWTMWLGCPGNQACWESQFLPYIHVSTFRSDCIRRNIAHLGYLFVPFLDFEGTMNSFLSLILMVTDKRDDLIRKFCNKIADGRAEESISQATLRV